MNKRWGWILSAGLPLLLIGGLPAVGHAATTEQKAQPPAKLEEQKAQAPAKTAEEKAQPAAKTEETAEQKAPEAAKAVKEPKAAERPAGRVGTIIAYSPAYRTIVVDVPLGPKGDRDTLRLGAQVTDRTNITMGSKTVSAETLKQGEKVRIAWHRVSSGDVASSIHILRSDKD